MKFYLILPFLITIGFSSTAFGNPSEAKDLAVGIAKNVQERGYVFSGISHIGRVTGAGSVPRFSLSLEPAVEYALVVGSDVGSVLVTVTDRSGNVIVQSKPANALNGVQFRSPYKGSVRVELEATRSKDTINYHSFLFERDNKRDGASSSAAAAATSSKVFSEISKVDSVGALKSRLQPLEEVVPENLGSPPKNLQDSVDFKYEELLKDGFTFMPMPNDFRYKGISKKNLMIPVQNGVEYVILVGVEKSGSKPAAYVHVWDETGGFLNCSAHHAREFSQRFTASHTGMAIVSIELTDRNAAGALILAIGRRVGR